jgi:hypothetical protein
MRIGIAGLIGGIVMFLWGFFAHMVLPLGETGLRTLPIAQQDAVLAASRAAMQDPGIYIVPGFEDMADYGDEAKRADFGRRAAANPYAFVVYQPHGKDLVNDMGPALAREFATNVLSAMLAALVAGAAALGMGRRALLIGTMGLFGWLANSVPLWNWYRFPTDFTLAALAMQVVGWLLAGFAIAWWLERQDGRARR